MNDSSCLEGVILLITCLPTRWSHTSQDLDSKNGPTTQDNHLDVIDYDKYMNKWLTIWMSIEKNHFWDVCWLTLFCRARKYCKVFDFKQLNNMLVSKLKDFLQICPVKGSSIDVEDSLSLLCSHLPYKGFRVDRYMI